MKDGGTLTVHPDGHSYTYSYGPKGIAGLIQSRYAMLAAGIASIGGLTFGYDQGVIANILVMDNFRTRFTATAMEIGLISMSSIHGFCDELR